MNIIFLLLLLLSSTVGAEHLLGLPELEIPADNPLTNEKIVLGKRLFNDARLSQDGTISCASCHQLDNGFADDVPKARGIGGKLGTRNTPTLLNAAYFNSFFHDGRAHTLEQQAVGPMLNPVEHGLSSEQQIVQIVLDDSEYKTAFAVAFAIPPAQLSITHISQAIASYQRTLIAGDSAFDRYYFGRDKSALSESAARGLRVFRRKGNCANCHEISWNQALFSDNRFYNIGIGMDKLNDKLPAFTALVLQGTRQQAEAMLSAEQLSTLGRFRVTGVMQDIGKFKTPILRNIALTAPYMHDGSIQTLTEVVDYYDKGGHKNRFLDAAIFPLKLTAQEKQDLLEFMLSLTSSNLEDFSK